ncbi:MAG: hypothetical protein AABY28_00640 [Candidatus Omnitrophota bacterium]
MKTKQAGKLVISLSEEWKVNSFLNLNKITKELGGSICRDYSDFNTFEFTLVSFEKTVRFLHLNFYKQDVSRDKIKILRERRVKSIVSIVKYLNKNPGLKYNFEILRGLASIIDDTSWPIQFGYEAGRDKSPVIKVYISIVGSNSNGAYFLKKLCALLGLKWEGLKSIFSRSDIDAIGIDLLHNGCHRLKIYTYFRPPFNLLNIRKIYKKYREDRDEYLDLYLGGIENMPLRHVGLLYRISKDSFIESVKIWARLEKPIPFKLLQPIMKSAPARLNRWLISASDIIKSGGGRVSYLTLENKKIGVYFR